MSSGSSKSSNSTSQDWQDNRSVTDASGGGQVGTGNSQTTNYSNDWLWSSNTSNTSSVSNSGNTSNTSSVSNSGNTSSAWNWSSNTSNTSSVSNSGNTQTTINMIDGEATKAQVQIAGEIAKAGISASSNAIGAALNFAGVQSSAAFNMAQGNSEAAFKSSAEAMNLVAGALKVTQDSQSGQKVATYGIAAAVVAMAVVGYVMAKRRG